MTQDRINALEDALRPFSRMARAMFARNWKRDGVAISLVEKDGPIRLTFADFLAAHQALDASQPTPEVRPGAPITLTYTNWKGETAERAIIPRRVWWGSTEWHPEPQWLLTAFDLDKQAERDFALKDFGPSAQPVATADGSSYRKKPVVIEAVQWTGENLREVIAFTDGPPDTKSHHAGMMWDQYEELVRKDGLKIYTLEGKMDASPGDWIIKGVKGEFYPCKDEIFRATYDPANHPTAERQQDLTAAFKAGIASVGIDGLKATSMFADQPAQPVAVKVKPLVWIATGDAGAFTAYDPLFERQVLSREPTAYDTERSDRITAALTPQPLTVQDAARVVADGLADGEVWRVAVNGAAGILNSGMPGSYWPRVKQIREALDAILRAIAEGRA